MTGKIHLIFKLEPLVNPELYLNAPSPSKRKNSPSSKPQQLANEDANIPTTPSNQSTKALLFGTEKIDPIELMKNGLALELTILDIDAYQLQAVHTFSRNSPYVSLACGKYSETSKVSILNYRIVETH